MRVLITQVLTCHGVHLPTSCKAIDNGFFDFEDVCPIYVGLCLPTQRDHKSNIECSPGSAISPKPILSFTANITNFWSFITISRLTH